jgi:hypothetical protein
MTISEVVADDALVLESYVADDPYLYVYTSMTTITMMMERGVRVVGSGGDFFSALLVQYPMSVNVRYAMRLQFIKLWSSDHVECLNFEYFFSAILKLSNRDLHIQTPVRKAKIPQSWKASFRRSNAIFASEALPLPPELR